MFHNERLSRELCVQCVDEFIRREQRYPTAKERTPKCGLPSDTAFRAHTGISMIKYCRANYPEFNNMDLESPPQTPPERLLWVEESALEAACRQWCGSLAEHPERADGQGFAEFVQAFQQQRQAEPQMGGMSMS